MTAADTAPAAGPPEGLRPAVLGLVAIGRVILGHSAVTLVDLAERDQVQVRELPGQPGGDWELSRAPGNGHAGLPPFEAAFLGALLDEHGSCLSQLTGRLEPAIQRFRHSLVHEAVSHGWFGHLDHDRRAPEGDQLAGQIMRFRAGLRRKVAGGADAVASQLPYALLFGLLPDTRLPLARFAHSWALACSQVPALRPAGPERPVHDEIDFPKDEWRGMSLGLAAAWASGI